jgi:hypothetical protein
MRPPCSPCRPLPFPPPIFLGLHCPPASLILPRHPPSSSLILPRPPLSSLHFMFLVLPRPPLPRKNQSHTLHYSKNLIPRPHFPRPRYKKPRTHISRASFLSGGQGRGPNRKSRFDFLSRRHPTLLDLPALPSHSPTLPPCRSFPPSVDRSLDPCISFM